MHEDVVLCARVSEVMSCCKNERFLDSGASKHMSFCKEYFSELVLKDSGYVSLGDNRKLAVKGYGKVKVNVNREEGPVTITMENVLFVPDLTFNLMSCRKIEEKVLKLIFENGKEKVSDERKVLFTAGWKEVAQLYMLKTTNCASDDKAAVVKESKGTCERIKTTDPMLLHQRLGHFHFEALTKIPELGLEGKKIDFCDVCVMGKARRKSYPKKSESATEEVLEIVHSDDVGKISPTSKGGANFAVTFLDDFSHYVVVKAIKNKSDVFSEFNKYKNQVENQCERKIKCFQSDLGGEYMSNKFQNYLDQCGIVRRLAVVGCKPQNGRSKRLNYTLFNLTRCMMIHAGAPKSFWAGGIKYSCLHPQRVPE